MWSARLESRVMIRSVLLWIVTVFLIVTAFWNIGSFDRRTLNIAPDEVGPQEARYLDVRYRLLDAGYRSGYVGFITNHDLRSESSTVEDDKRWAQAQFALIPWIVLRGGSRSLPGEIVKAPTPFVIGDFWDGLPPDLPPDLVKLHESEDGLVLFRRKSPE